jgi:hypothetical protein
MPRGTWISVALALIAALGILALMFWIDSPWL